MARLLLVIALAVVGLVGVGSARAYAEPDPPAKCFRANDAGEPPVCTWDGHQWSVTGYDSGFPGTGLNAGGGAPGWFGGMVVLVLVAGAGLTIWRVSLARSMARDAGMDPDRATAVTLLADEGLEATYLSSNLRGPTPTPTPTPAPAPARTAEGRLRELGQLRDQGLLTEAEYQSRRQAVIDSL